METRINTETGKQEQKDPITGCWVLSHAQFINDNPRIMGEIITAMDEDNQRVENELKNPEKLQPIIDRELQLQREDGNVVSPIKVVEVLKVEASQTMKSDSVKVEFIGVSEWEKHKYSYWATSYYGDFYEPPSEDSELVMTEYEIEEAD